MKLIEDLGMERLKSGKTTRFSICECEICGVRQKLRMSDFKNNPDRSCKACYWESKRKTTAQFIEDAKKVHGDTFIYSKVNYIDRITPVIITCRIHDDYHQTPQAHLDGSGCKHCFEERNKNQKTKKTTEQFIEECKLLFGNRFLYHKVDYVNNKTPVEFICSEHNLSFFPRSGNVIAARNFCGCKLCVEKVAGYNIRTKNTDKYAILYYIKISGSYKIGVTASGLYARFLKEKDVQLISATLYATELQAYYAESIVLDNLHEHRNFKDKVLADKGSSEIFQFDIMDTYLEAVEITKIYSYMMGLPITIDKDGSIFTKLTSLTKVST